MKLRILRKNWYELKIEDLVAFYNNFHPRSKVQNHHIKDGSGIMACELEIGKDGKKSVDGSCGMCNSLMYKLFKEEHVPEGLYYIHIDTSYEFEEVEFPPKG